MNLLFVCSQNQWRSPTAENIFSNESGVNTRSVGTEKGARRKVQKTDIHWADIIFVMEKKHLERLKNKFSNLLKTRKVINLRIPDKYDYMDPQLVEVLKEKINALLK